VNAAIDTREAITVSVGGICLRGTYHKCRDTGSGSPVGIGRTDRLGLLFLNHGFLPRAAPGDSAVYWGNSLATCGYPSFRFDLPGLGDSDGDAPPQMLDFVNSGGYAPVVSAIVEELVARFKLAGIVIVGHCSGSVTALYTAPLTKECKGLVLTDPYFFLPRERTKIRVELSHWSSWSRLGALVSSVYYLLKHIRLLVGRNRPPRNANLPLLRCWNHLSSAGMPILVLKAPALKARGLKPRMGEFDYLGYLQSMSGRGSRIAVEFIEGTNHSFADIRGRAAVREHIEQWLSASFPRASRDRGADRSSSTAPEGAYEPAVPR
jgi:pimeloyl-ACP methyl ester carboxylesterase